MQGNVKIGLYLDGQYVQSCWCYYPLARSETALCLLQWHTQKDTTDIMHHYLGLRDNLMACRCSDTKLQTVHACVNNPDMLGTDERCHDNLVQYHRWLVRTYTRRY